MRTGVKQVLHSNNLSPLKCKKANRPVQRGSPIRQMVDFEKFLTLLIQGYFLNLIVPS